MEIIKEHPHTAIILSSGNGVSNGPFYVTDIGQREHQLPLLTMIMPEHLQLRYPEAFANMNANQQQLVTPFDLYTTMIHLMLFPQVELPSRYNLIHHVKAAEQEAAPTEENPEDDFEAVAKSLLHPIHEQPRSCFQAGIDEKWCVCARDDVLDLNDQRISALATTIVKAGVAYVNKVVQKHKTICHTIDSKKILKFKRITAQTPKQLENGKEAPYIASVLFQTKTGDVFEVDYSLLENETLDRLMDVRRVSLIEHHDEAVKNRENVVCDKLKGFEGNPDLCVCRMG